MKIGIKRIVLMLLMLMLVPCTALFSACGATPTNEARYVRFESNVDLYEDGKAIFEVDVGVKTKLNFKVTPSSWSGYVPTYRVRSGGYNVNLLKFNLKEGEILVSSPTFEPIEVEVIVNGHSDICEVRLKEYPTSICLENNVSEVTINGGEIYSIPLRGIFETSETPVVISESRYNFEVISSDERIIEVENPGILKVKATQKVCNDFVQVKVSVLDQTGEIRKNDAGKDISVTIKFKVVQIAKFGYLNIEDCDELIYDDSSKEIVINASNFYHIESSSYAIYFDFCVVSENNVKIEDFEYDVYCTNATNVMPGVIEFDRPSGNTLNLRIAIYTNLNKANLTAYSFIVDIVLQF